MNPQLQLWMPAVLSLFGASIVVVLAALLSTRMLSAQVESVRAELRAEIGAVRAELRGELGAEIGTLPGEIGALRAEMKQGFAELRLEFHQQFTELSRRVERLEEVRGLVRP
jgi:sensor domain CHASE-containing protein